MFNDIIKRTNARRARDKERFTLLDREECMLCGAYGADKRSLYIDHGYAMHESVPEVIDLHNVDNQPNMYYLLTCKMCRAALLQHLAQWRSERLALRDEAKNHDGYLLEDDFGLIPVRVNGAITHMSPDEYENWKRGQDDD